jgi:hypothetical protein
MPEVLAALQRSVHNVLLGKQPRPDWITHGIPRSMLIDIMKLKFMAGCGTALQFYFFLLILKISLIQLDLIFNIWV